MAVDLAALETLAVRAAAAAARVHHDGLSHVQSAEAKSSPTDMVTEVDREAERVIIDAIVGARPDDAILGEEGTDRAGTSGVRWIIDPLDGTTNYLYRFPAYAVSIGIEVDGRHAFGVVHDSSRDHVYVGGIGRPATCDGRPIAVRAAVAPGLALVATGFQYQPALRTRQADALRHVLPRVRDIRRAGSAALDLCALAAGQIDAYYELGLGAWDLAAGVAIAVAAGARVVSLPVPDTTPLLVAAAPGLLEPLLALLTDAGMVAPGVPPTDLG